MHLLIIVLNKEEYLDDVLEAFIETGITGATIVDSVGMGKTLAYHIPIFAGLRKSIKIKRNSNIIDARIFILNYFIIANIDGKFAGFNRITFMPMVSLGVYMFNNFL